MKNSVGDLPYSDLYSMYLFASAQYNVAGSKTPEAKLQIKKRLAELEKELYDRTFGFNPYKEHAAKEEEAV
jgi:hypothetical protein